VDGDLLALYRLGAGAGSQDLLLEAHPSLLLRLFSVSSLWAAAFVLRIATGACRESLCGLVVAWRYLSRFSGIFYHFLLQGAQCLFPSATRWTFFKKQNDYSLTFLLLSVLKKSVDSIRAG